ncbi:MAG: hypothetical protein ACOZCO_05100 [Bacteroidota bacterium]
MLWDHQFLSSQINDTDFYKKCASSLVAGKRYEDIKTLISALEDEEEENLCLVISCILFEVAQIEPSLLEKEVDSFIKVCLREKKVLHNNSLKILIVLAPSQHKIIFKKLDIISDVFFDGSDDVKDAFITLLIRLAKISPDYYDETCGALKVILEYYPAEALVKNAEKMLPIIDKTNFECFQNILVNRKKELNSSDQKQVENLLSQILGKITL